MVEVKGGMKGRAGVRVSVGVGGPTIGTYLRKRSSFFFLGDVAGVRVWFTLRFVYVKGGVIIGLALVLVGRL